jgi:hypothetical protein
MKGKGSDGVWRNIVGTFMGWAINMTKQLSKGLQSHSGDSQAPAVINAMIGLATIVILMSAVGAWNWEFGDELTKKLYGISSARVQLGNIQGVGDWQTSLLYLMQAMVNVVPLIGSSIGGLAGVAYTGRGNPFDMTNLSPQIGFAAGAFNTVKRIIQTGDASLPLADFIRQWVPMSKMLQTHIPIVRGLVDQQNAVRSLNASAPPGTEIKWGKRGGSGDAKYSPANDEVQKLIGAAYEAAAHGGSIDEVRSRMNDAIAALVASGRSPGDAQKALASALSAKEPIRVLTGREMTPEEEQRWIARMTPSQRADYDRAVEAWKILGGVTGKDLNMVSGKGGGGGGGRAIPSRAVGLGGRPLGAAGSSLGGIRIPAPSSYGIAPIRPSGPRRGGTRRRTGTRTTRRRPGVSPSRRRLGPSIGRPGRAGRSTSRRRRGLLA